MARTVTARQYAEEMARVHGSEAKVIWMTIGELLDLYELVYEDRNQDELEREKDEKDMRDTQRSIISEMYPF